MDGVQMQNAKGRWVPAVPEPLWVGFRLRKAKCHCGEVRKSRQSYVEHYVYEHLFMER